MLKTKFFALAYLLFIFKGSTRGNVCRVRKFTDVFVVKKPFRGINLMLYYFKGLTYEI